MLLAGNDNFDGCNRILAGNVGRVIINFATNTSPVVTQKVAPKMQLRKLFLTELFPDVASDICKNYIIHSGITELLKR